MQRGMLGRRWLNRPGGLSLLRQTTGDKCHYNDYREPERGFVAIAFSDAKSRRSSVVVPGHRRTVVNDLKRERQADGLFHAAQGQRAFGRRSRFRPAGCRRSRWAVGWVAMSKNSASTPASSPLTASRWPCRWSADRAMLGGHRTRQSGVGVESGETAVTSAPI